MIHHQCHGGIQSATEHTSSSTTNHTQLLLPLSLRNQRGQILSIAANINRYLSAMPEWSGCGKKMTAAQQAHL